MDELISILVLGLGPIASAVARLLLLAGHAVALQRRAPPKILRRKMSFADAWSQGVATLDGVDARLVRNDRSFLAALRQKNFIPLLTEDATGRWPWDVVIDATGETGGAEAAADFNARLRICLGGGRTAGEDCDLAIAIEGPDPGALIREGRAPAPEKTPGDARISARSLVAAPLSGLFRPAREIGDLVAKDELLGLIDRTPIRSRLAGRIVGLSRECAFASGEPVAEVTIRRDAPFSGVGKDDQALARAVLLAIQMEWSDWAEAPQF